jgi:2-polyprenyl-6-methoxyphenol hydroxylase-like FAD-dependent oxidoreductase
VQLEVLIVGAGPVGMTAACELACFCISVRIVDKSAQRTDKSKAWWCAAGPLNCWIADLAVQRQVEALGFNEATLVSKKRSVTPMAVRRLYRPKGCSATGTLNPQLLEFSAHPM